MVALGYVQGSEPGTEESGVVRDVPGAPWPGHNLVLSAHAPEALLLDMQGNELHRWQRSFAEVWPERPEPPPSARHHRYWRRVHLLPDGSLLAIFENFGLVKLDRDSKVLWTWDRKAHHDLAVAPDGRLFVLMRSRRRIPSMNAFHPVLDDSVAVLSPEGRELRRISIYDALADSPYADWLATAREAGRDDLFHTNSIEWLDGSQGGLLPAFRAGNLLLSLHGLHAVAVLDPGAGRVVWALRGSFRYQHEATLLPSGHLLLFDNTGAGERSRVLELDPRTGELAWSYERSEPPVFFSLCCGTAQRLPNGDTLVTETQRGRAFELDPSGKSVWEYRNPHRVGPQGETRANLFEVRRLASSETAAWLAPRARAAPP